ncbi:MAG: three-Cys-motif partner protein TcmP [Planctomycetes bacterium]|nr:three-Cys-motif partner protein TcmP [Planctomycetota bacterium]
MNELPHLKEISKVKHAVLQKYLPAWEQILSSWHNRLVYIDCYAGAGVYRRGEPGSPIIALRTAKSFLQIEKNKNKEVVLFFIDKDKKTIDSLEQSIKKEGQLPTNLKCQCIQETAGNFVEELLKQVPKLAPAFFFIDPYGHPLPIPVMNKILERKSSEIFVNVMWHQINRDISNPQEHGRVTTLFGSEEWKRNPFINLRGLSREHSFIEYFKSLLKADFKFPFQVRFSKEDKVKGGENRTKYYLIHLSKHWKAVYLMKFVMSKLSQEEGLFYTSGRDNYGQQIIKFNDPMNEAKSVVLSKYKNGDSKTFEQILIDCWEYYFLEGDIRKALQQMEGRELNIVRIESKKTGLKGRDKVIFK